MACGLNQHLEVGHMEISMLQKQSNIFLFPSFIAMTFLIVGCGGSDYNGGSTASSPSGTSPVQQSSVQEVPDCFGGVQSESINVQANTFSPGSGTITRGQIVKFENLDLAAHTVTSGGPNTQDRLFDITLSPNGAQNDERCLKFTAPGTFPYFDKLHPLQTGVIIVQ